MYTYIQGVRELGDSTTGKNGILIHEKINRNLRIFSYEALFSRKSTLNIRQDLILMN